MASLGKVQVYGVLIRILAMCKQVVLPREAYTRRAELQVRRADVINFRLGDVRSGVLRIKRSKIFLQMCLLCTARQVADMLSSFSRRLKSTDIRDVSEIESTMVLTP